MKIKINLIKLNRI